LPWPAAGAPKGSPAHEARSVCAAAAARAPPGRLPSQLRPALILVPYRHQEGGKTEEFSCGAYNGDDKQDETVLVGARFEPRRRQRARRLFHIARAAHTPPSSQLARSHPPFP
jgi:hypothetical protein